jgi:hypothetical protein
MMEEIIMKKLLLFLLYMSCSTLVMEHSHPQYFYETIDYKSEQNNLLQENAHEVIIADIREK